MTWGAPYHSIPRLLAVMYVNPMYDNIGDELYCDACTISYVDINSTAVYCLEAVHDQLLLQLDDHVPLEHNPQRPVLDDSITEGAWFRIHWVVIAGVSYDVVPAVPTANRITAKANAAVSKALTVEMPVGVTAPAVIYGVASSATEKSQLSPLRAIPDAPDKQKFMM